jgi:hypothetical protein
LIEAIIAAMGRMKSNYESEKIMGYVGNNPVDCLISIKQHCLDAQDLQPEIKS